MTSGAVASQMNLHVIHKLCIVVSFKLLPRQSHKSCAQIQYSWLEFQTITHLLFPVKYTNIAMALDIYKAQLFAFRRIICILTLLSLVAGSDHRETLHESIINLAKCTHACHAL